VTTKTSLAPRTPLLTAIVLAAAILAGCGGGAYGGSSAVYGGPGNQPSPNPQTVPLSTATLKGAAGFVDNAGMTVYVFDLDLQTPGQSSCNGECAQNWPPLIAPAGNLPSPYSAIARQDGRSQLAYNGRPLYAYTGDSAPGQTNGDGLNAFGGIWHIARP
jgi:predicted lipoprotein with Yx(FWY)xxD motif